MYDGEYKVGDKVLFGREAGERTLGEVVKINRVKIKVKQLEARGTFRSYPVGTIWTVPPSLVLPANGAHGTQETPVKLPEAPKRSEGELMSTIVGLYSRLSPENLSCDGELPRYQVRRRAAQYNRELRGCFKELGRTVSEDAAYSWECSQREARG